MIENELIALWQSSPRHEQIKFEKSKLMLDVQSSLDRFDRTINRRDLIEIGTAIIMIPIFLYQGYRLPSMLAKVGAILVAIWCSYVIYKLLKLKKTKPSEASSYLDYLKQSKKYLEGHKRLFDRVLYWYILPGLIGVLMIMIGVLDLFNKPWQEIIRIKRMWVSLTIFVVIGVFTYHINKWGIRKELVPRIKKVNELIRLMEEEL